MGCTNIQEAIFLTGIVIQQLERQLQSAYNLLHELQEHRNIKFSNGRLHSFK